MIEEKARVIAIDHDQLLLEAETRAACSACGVRQGCGTAVLSRWIGRKFTRFQAPNSVNASVGDEVIVGLAEGAMLKGSVFVYLLPLLSMIVFALLADSLIPADTDARDLLVLLFAVAGFMLMLVGARLWLSSARNKTGLTPVVLRKNIVGP